MTHYAYDVLERLTMTIVHPLGGVNRETTLVDGNGNALTRTTPTASRPIPMTTSDD